MFRHIKNTFRDVPVPSFDYDQGVNRVVDGREIIGRPSIGFGDVDFTYAGKCLKSNPWDSHETVLKMKEKLEAMLDISFAHCLIGLYLDETVSIPFHKDEIQGPEDLIVSVSMGATRDFLIRDNETGDIRKLILVHGDVVVMDYDSQQKTQHAVPPGKFTPRRRQRVNLTFRSKTLPSPREDK
jgi:alkylated DNA repair dioxygenase AlkB